MKFGMNDIDRKIIDILQNDGRMGYADLARQVGLSQSAIHDRVRRLTEAGAMRVVAIIDPTALDLGILAFTWVALERPEHDAGFVAAMGREPRVQECHHVTGDWSYLLKLRCRSTVDLEQLLAGVIKAQAGVVRSHTAIALSSPKETHRMPCYVALD